MFWVKTESSQGTTVYSIYKKIILAITVDGDCKFRVYVPSVAN